MKNQHPRKIKLINPSFQLRFIAATLILLLFSIVSIYISIQYAFVNFIEVGIEKSIDPNSEYFNIISSQEAYLSNFIIIVGVILFVGTAIWGLYFSHRIAGPLYKLNKYFADSNQLEGTKLRPLSFRKDDFLHEITDNINKYLEKNHLLDKD